MSFNHSLESVVSCVFVCECVCLFVKKENKAQATEMILKTNNIINTKSLKCKNLGFPRRYRRSVEWVLKVEHGSARWDQGVIYGVKVGPGQPAGQVGLEPLHLLLLLLEEQLCSSQTFISCPVILPTEKKKRTVCQKKKKNQLFNLMPYEICLLFTGFLFAFSIKGIL